MMVDSLSASAATRFGAAMLLAWAAAACSSNPAGTEASSAMQAGASATSAAAVGGSGGTTPATMSAAGGMHAPASGGSAGTAMHAGSATAGASAATAGMSAAGAGGQAGASGSAGAMSAEGSAGSAAGSGGSSMSAPATGSCAGATTNLTPFGCMLAWGTNDPGGSLSAFAGLSFMSKWVGYEVDKDGNVPTCDGCTWLSSNVRPTSLIPVYYAYFIGYLGHANGLPDGNQNPNGPNLTTDAAVLIREHRDQLVGMYASYAKQSAAVWKDKPLVWLLEGDFVQYTDDTQKQKLSLMELAELARDITCAIKSNMPNAVVAINHTTWNSDQMTNDFWSAMDAAGVAYDMVWTTGVANNMGFIEKMGSASSYNAMTATYAYVAKKTGRKVFVDTSFGQSQMDDSWSTASVEDLNARIADGVIAVDVTMPPSNYVSTVQGFASKLDAVCSK
jgi:hypothetical protein